MAAQMLEINGWQPTTTNRLLRANRYERSRLIYQDAEMILRFAQSHGIIRAVARRRVTLVIRYNQHTKSGRVDPDALYKSGLDGLVQAGLLVDDDHEWCELGTPRYEIAQRKGIVFILEDL